MFLFFLSSTLINVFKTPILRFNSFTSGKYQRAELKKKIWDELRFDDLLFAAT